MNLLKMMPLTEIEFELSAEQYQRMGYPGLAQGEVAKRRAGDRSVTTRSRRWKDGLPYEKEPLAPRFIQVAPATYAFAGAIEASRNRS